MRTEIDQSKITKEDYKELAQQLRKPKGELGIQVGNHMNDGNSAMNLHTLAVLEPKANDRILELGMGNGFFVKNILTLDPTIQYVGCDYSEEMVAEASRLNQTWIKKERAAFVCHPATDIPFTAASFNKIFTVNTIYFWEEVNVVIKELKRLLLPNGEIIIAFRPEDNMKQFPVTAYGFNFFTKEKVETALKENGFNTIDVVHVFEGEEFIFGKKMVKECLIVKAI